VDDLETVGGGSFERARACNAVAHTFLPGRAPLDQCGNAMRWAVKFKDEYFGTLQGVQMIGFA